MKIHIPAPAKEILERLNEQGYEAYVVGGCVRDMLLGRSPGDWDITTSALPWQVKAVFRRTVDTGIQHGTVTVLMGKEGYEVTTYRIDGEYSDGRHPNSVTFTPELIEDLKRRDFTINAMAYNQRTGFVDAFGGVEDLKAGVIRCVGNPMDRFTEDALRILRAIRFSAQLDFKIETETYEAIQAIAPNMAKVSKERIQTELTKLLLSGRPEDMALVYETGISPYVSESFHQAYSTGSIPSIPVSIQPEKHLRWAAFLRKCTPDQAVQILKELKLDNDTMNKVKILVAWLPILLWGQEKEEGQLRQAMSQMEPELFDDLLHMKEALAGTGDQVPETVAELKEIRGLTDEIRRRGDCICLKDLALTGHDVMKAGVKPGKAVGQALGFLFELVLKDPGKNDRDLLFGELGRWLHTEGNTE